MGNEPTTAPPRADHQGTVATCWRYPVKSLQGLRTGELTITPAGVVGDRVRGLVDAGDGHLLSAKRTAALLDAAATDVAITLPDGTVVNLDHPLADDVLSAWLGRAVRLVAPQSGRTVNYRMTFDPPDDGAEEVEIPAPTGSFLDLAALHLVTTATLEGCSAARPDLDWDERRFRPNLVVAAAGDPFVEDGWVGKRLRIGSAVLSVDQPTVRCAMPLRAQPGPIDRQPDLFAAMGELNPAAPNHLGVYCSVVRPGTVRTGDRVEVV
jgi:uncharacterized protein